MNVTAVSCPFCSDVEHEGNEIEIGSGSELETSDGDVLETKSVCPFSCEDA